MAGVVLLPVEDFDEAGIVALNNNIANLRNVLRNINYQNMNGKLMLTLGGAGSGNGVLSILDALGIEIVRGDYNGLLVNGATYLIKDRGGALATTVWPMANMLQDNSLEMVLLNDLNPADVLGMPPNLVYYDYNPNLKGGWFGWSTWIFDAGGVEVTQMAPYFSSVRNTTNYNYASYGKSMVCVNSTNYFSQGIDLIPGQTYFVSASHCRLIGALAGGPSFRSAVGSNLQIEVAWSNNWIETGVMVATNFTSSTDWKRDGFSFTVPTVGVNGARIRVKGQDANWIYVDAVQLVQGSTPGKYDSNDDLADHLFDDPYPHKTLKNIIPGGISQQAWQTPTLLNAWANLGAPYSNAGYRKDTQGKVHLMGAVSAGVVGAGTPIFTLPVGYRPATQKGCSVVSNNAFGRVDVLANGNVEVIVGNNASVLLDDISFWTD